MTSFDNNGKYIKTNWKNGDRITADKLNKIEESIEAVNDNDISRHVETDTRLDALEAKVKADSTQLADIESKTDKYIIYPNNVDDTTNIQNVLSNNKYSKLVFKEGIYFISNPLKINRGITIELSAGVIIKAINNCKHILTISRANNVFINGRGVESVIDMQRGTNSYTNEYGHAITIGRECKNVVINNFKIINTGGDGICIGDSSNTISPNSITIKNMIIDNCNRNGISVTHADNVLIDNCTIKNNNSLAPKSGIDVETNPASGDLPNSKVTNVIIRNCNVSDNGNFGIGIFYNVRNVEILNCTTENNTTQGIVISGHSGDKGKVYDARVEDCYCKNNVRAGIEVNYSSRVNVNKCELIENNYGLYTVLTEGFDIDNNYISNNTSDAIHIVNGKNFNIKNNRLDYNLSGVYVKAGNSSNILTSGNIIHNNSGDGIYVNGGIDCRVYNNIIHNNSARGVIIMNCNNLNIYKNTLYNNVATGILIQGGDSHTNNIIDGNYCYDNGVYTNSTYKNNIQIHSGNRTIVRDNIVRTINNTDSVNTIGINIHTATNTLYYNNDCYQGGSYRGISCTDATATNLGNICKDGTYSTTNN